MKTRSLTLLPKPIRHSRAAASRSAFTLVEILVATAISLVLVGIILAVAQSAMETNGRIIDSTRRDSDALFALNTIVGDLEALLVPRQRDSDALVAVAEDVGGVSSTRLALLTTATDRDPDGHHGGERAVAYRLALQNPIDGQAAEPVYALYRSVVSVADTAATPLVTGTSLLEYWDAATPPTTDPENYLVANVVRFAIRFRRADSGQWLRILPTQSFLIDRDGAFTSTTANPSTDPNIGNGKLPEGVDAVEVELTFLTPRGAKLLTDGAITLAEATTRFGRSFVRQSVLTANSGL